MLKNSLETANGAIVWINYLMMSRHLASFSTFLPYHAVLHTFCRCLVAKYVGAATWSPHGASPLAWSVEDLVLRPTWDGKDPKRFLGEASAIEVSGYAEVLFRRGT